MRVLCFVLLAARVCSLPQESASADGAAENQASSETTTFPPVIAEAVASDNSVLEALEQELIKNNITLTRDTEVPKDIAQVAAHYAKVQASTPHHLAESPSLRRGSGGAGGEGQGGGSTAAFIAAFGVGSIVSLAKVALVMMALNSGLREAFVSMNGAATGTLRLRQEAAPFGPTAITGTLNGLTEGKHGFHIHELGNTTEGCASTGGHYNPFQTSHGAPNSLFRHVGDLGNIQAFANGTAFVNITDSQILLVGPTSVIGRAVVVHELEDDLGLGGDEGSTIHGNAGSRVGCGVIGRA